MRNIVKIGLSISLLTGCTSTASSPPGKTRVEVWETRTTSVGDEKQTTKTHSVGYRNKPEKGIEWAFKGLWHIQDYTNEKVGARNCYVNLYPARLDAYNFKLKITENCPAEMRNIAAWRPTGNPLGNNLVLVGHNGANIGLFDKVQNQLFRGSFELATGEVVKAHVKRW